MGVYDTHKNLEKKLINRAKSLIWINQNGEFNPVHTVEKGDGGVGGGRGWEEWGLQVP